MTHKKCDINDKQKLCANECAPKCVCVCVLCCDLTSSQCWFVHTLNPSSRGFATFVRDLRYVCVSVWMWMWVRAVCDWWLWICTNNSLFRTGFERRKKMFFFLQSRNAFVARVSFSLFCWHFFSMVYLICIHLVADKLESALVTIFLYVRQHFR